MSVKQITPLVSAELRRGAPWPGCPIRPTDAHHDLMRVGVTGESREVALTRFDVVRHNYTDNGYTASPSRRESRSASRLRGAASSSRGGPRPALWITRVFRCPGSGAGEIRNAAAGRCRGAARQPDGRGVRLFPAHLLSSADRVQGAGPARVGAAQARAARGAQTRRRRDGLCDRVADRRPRPAHTGPARPYSAALWPRRPSAHRGARPPARGKKTTLTVPALVAVDIPKPVLVSSYETLRRVALGPSGPDDGPRLGFTLLLRQGMTAWLHAWARCPRPAVPEPAAVSLSTIPPLVPHELAQVWAHMVLVPQEVPWT